MGSRTDGTWNCGLFLRFQSRLGRLDSLSNRSRNGLRGSLRRTPRKTGTPAQSRWIRLLPSRLRSRRVSTVSTTRPFRPGWRRTRPARSAESAVWLRRRLRFESLIAYRLSLIACQKLTHFFQAI